MSDTEAEAKPFRVTGFKEETASGSVVFVGRNADDEDAHRVFLRFTPPPNAEGFRKEETFLALSLEGAAVLHAVLGHFLRHDSVIQKMAGVGWIHKSSAWKLIVPSEKEAKD